jgi:hypothetical protein
MASSGPGRDRAPGSRHAVCLVKNVQTVANRGIWATVVVGRAKIKWLGLEMSAN